MAAQLSRIRLPVAPPLQAAIERFDCVGERHSEDPVAAEVREFLRERGFEQGIAMGYSSTFVLVDDEQPHPRDVLAYTTLAIDSIRLSGSELKLLDRPYFPDFGAIRLAMIGVDYRYQQRGYGALILRAVADMAMTIADVIAVRFLLADANVTQQKWYEGHGWVLNRSERYQDPGGTTVSMRLDLLLD